MNCDTPNHYSIVHMYKLIIHIGLRVYKHGLIGLMMEKNLSRKNCHPTSSMVCHQSSPSPTGRSQAPHTVSSCLHSSFMASKRRDFDWRISTQKKLKKLVEIMGNLYRQNLGFELFLVVMYRVFGCSCGTPKNHLVPEAGRD